ncbi:putative RDD family membrane protein YckC [Variovorax boronicumulans]|uniref:RDD family protein n=1 Tax=Variovorax boronicumulans TaxID=436515 RepID=UPI0027838A93|nr:RDD family protein [Variovorax boronicumulans]MDQ0070762.1 putative RDD family membrane protein YckC [Variovorax boronicumulans]
MVSSSPEASGPDQPASPDAPANGALASTVPGLWRRMACWLYEGMLLFAVAMTAGWLFSALSQMRNAMDETRRPLLLAYLFVVFGVYFIWFWCKGQTLGMKTWNIRIVDRQGRPLTQSRAFLRYILSWIWLLPPLALHPLLGVPVVETMVLLLGWIAVWAVLARFHPERQFWHDAWAGTRLITSKPMSRR